MTKSSSLPLILNAGLLAGFLYISTVAHAKNLGWNADTLSQELAAIKHLQPAPKGVTHLAFNEFFASPISSRGLEYTTTIKHLEGQRVRILGFMVKQTRPSPGTIMLAPYATTTHEGEYGLCDDLPPATLFVHVPKYADLAVPFTPGPLLLTGKLELGPHQEPDGRVSHVRLVLDPEADTTISDPVKTATTTN